MSIDTIGARVASRGIERELQERNDEAKNFMSELIVPISWRQFANFTPASISNSPWNEKMKAIIQEGVEAHLFGSRSTDKVLSALFKEARQGCCQGIVECVSVDRNPRVPIEETVKKVLSNRDRFVLVQICYLLAKGFKRCLEVDDREWFLEQIDKACVKSEEWSKKEKCKVCSKIFAEAHAFYKNEHIENLDDPRIVAWKFRALQKFVIHDNRKNKVVRLLTIDSEEKLRKIGEMREKIIRLKEEILGASLHVPELVVRKLNGFRGDLFQKTNLWRIREIQCLSPTHIESCFRQQRINYFFDPSAYLLKSPYPLRCSGLLSLGGYKCKIFTR